MRISLQKAADLLCSGHVVAVPTETVYGLAASLAHPPAIDAIFQLKGRPSNNPLIVHLSHIEQLDQFVDELPFKFYQLAQAFWPGPMTIVLPTKVNAISEKVSAGLKTTAFRIPKHPLARKLIHKTGPLVMPSANLSTRPSATSVDHVEADFGHDFPVLDGGSSECGLESTILIYQDNLWQIIRLGALPEDSFKDVLGYIPRFEKRGGGDAPLCPGQLYRHYAPKAKLELVEKLSTHMQGSILGYEDRQYPQGLIVISLGATSNPEGVGEDLYKNLRELDVNNIQNAWVDIDVPCQGIWKTILERLKKASE